MDFSVGNYEKPSDPLEMPAWAKTPSSKKLYSQCIVDFEIIKSNMASQTDLPIKERKIVLRRLARECKVDPSLLSSRRQPDLVEFITKKNQELDNYWGSISSAKNVSGKKLTKVELLKQLELVKAELRLMENLRLAEAFTSAIQQNLAVSKSKLVLLNEQLSIENKELRERNEALNRQLREVIFTRSREDKV